MTDEDDASAAVADETADDVVDSPDIDEQPTTSRSKWRFTPSGAVLRGGARGAATLVAAALGLGLILVTGLGTVPSYQAGVPDVVVDPVPAAKQRLCAGPVLRLGGATGAQATVATSVGRPVVVTAAGDADVDRAPLAVTDNLAGVAPDLLTLPPQSVDAAPALSGSQSETVDSGTFRGFAASDCLEARGETWLAAGAATVGRTSLISLSNPSSVEASVDLTIWGATGEVSAPGSTGIIVPPGAQRVYPLSGFAPGADRTVVRVASRGGPVVASMHESIVRTLEPGGVDIAGPTAAPAERLTIPGVVIASADAVTAAGATVGFEDVEPVIRMLAPGTEAGSATITITRALGPEATAGSVPETFVFPVALEPGMVQDVPVLGLVDGDYTVAVTASQPVVASARVTTISPDGAADLAWVTAADVLDDDSTVVVAPGPNPLLTLANPTGDAVSATIDDGDSERTIELEPRTSVAIPVVSRAALDLSGVEGLVAAVSYSGPGAIASFPVSVPAASSTAVRVYR